MVREVGARAKLVEGRCEPVVVEGVCCSHSCIPLVMCRIGSLRWLPFLVRYGRFFQGVVDVGLRGIPVRVCLLEIV